MSKFNNLKTGSNSINISRQPQFFFQGNGCWGGLGFAVNLNLKKKKKRKTKGREID
jgi:hypothetical protein